MEKRQGVFEEIQGLIAAQKAAEDTTGSGGASAPRPDFDSPARPDPVGPGQTLLRRIDLERSWDHERGLERERIRYRRGLNDPRYD